MKKGIIVLLIAVLVSGFAFAKFSGYAGVQFNADLNAKDVGFANKGKAEFTFEFATDSKELTGENLYVELAASAKAVVDKLDGGKIDSTLYSKYDENATKYGIGLILTIDTAKIVGQNWYVSILGPVDSAYDYAVAAVSTAYQDKDKNAFGFQKISKGNKKWKESASSYAVNFNNPDGVTIGYEGFTASLGFWYQGNDPETLDGFEGYRKGTSFSATIETPEFAFNDDAIKFQVAAEASKTTYYKATDTTHADPKAVDAGASVKGSVAIQDITVGVAADFGLEGIRTDNVKFAMDARADFAYKFVAVNVYTYVGKDGILYGGDDTVKAADLYNNFYLEAKAAFDLNEFEVPVKVAVTAKNIIDKSDAKPGIKLGVSAEFEKDALAAAGSFGFNINTKVWDTLVKGKYDFEKFTAGAGVLLNGAEDGLTKASFGVFAETDKLVENVRFGLAYGLDPDNNMEKGGWATVGNYKKYSNDFQKDNAGKASAYAFIKF